MFRAQQFRMTFSAVLLAFLGVGITQSRADQLLDAIPSDAAFCIRINDLDATLGKIDQLAAGDSSMPTGVAMIARMQLAGILGNPALTGVDMSGDIAVFGTSIKGAAGQPERMFIGILLPTTDYKQFASSNPNIGQPDANGISLLTVESTEQALVIEAKGYALLGDAENREDFVATAKLLSAQETPSLGSGLESSLVEKSSEGIWAYVNIASLAPQISETVTAFKGMNTGLTGEQGNAASTAQMDVIFGLLETIARQGKSLTITCSPGPGALKLSPVLTITPNQETSESGGSRELFSKAFVAMGAQAPGEKTESLEAISKHIPEASEANLVGTFSLLSPAKMGLGFASQLSAMPSQPLTAELQTKAFYAISFADEMVKVEIVVPKEHFTELSKVMMQQQMPGGPEVMGTEGEKSGELGVPSVGMEADEGAEVAVEVAPEPMVILDPNVNGIVIEPGVGINGVRFGTAAEQLKQVFGEPKAVSGRMYQYFDSGFYVVADSNDKIDAIYCGALNSADMVAACTCKTKQNVAMGSTKDDLTNAYGKPTHIYEYSGDTIRYEYDNIKSQFILKDNKVVQMMFRKPG